MRGSLINPFQPTVVRGFSKYTRLQLQLARVLHRRAVIVDRAGAHHQHQPVVGAVQDAMQGLARLIRGLGRRVGGRKFAQDMPGRR
jgi:hypothetical protein